MDVTTNAAQPYYTKRKTRPLPEKLKQFFQVLVGQSTFLQNRGCSVSFIMVL